MDDTECLAAILAGDEQGLRILHDRHLPWLRTRLLRRCGDPDLTDQAVQDTFVAVWRSAGSYRGSGDVAAWIWGIAIRRLVDQLRAQRNQPVIHARSEPSAEDVTLELDLASSDAGTALAALPNDLITVIQARVIDGLSSPEVAVLLGIPEGTVRSRLHRARQLLREVLR